MTDKEFKIVRATSADNDRVFEFLLEHYYNEEPVAKALKHKMEKDECVSQVVLESNLSFLIVRKDDPNILIGLYVNFKVGQFDEVFDAMYARLMRKYEGTLYGKIITLYQNTSIDAYKQMEEQYWIDGENNETMELCYGCFRKEDQRKGLMQLLLDNTIALAKEHNFRWLIVQCSNFYSYKGMTKNGFEVLSEIRYEDCFKDEEGNPTLEIEAPHTGLVYLVKDLGSDHLRSKYR